MYNRKGGDGRKHYTVSYASPKGMPASSSSPHHGGQPDSAAFPSPSYANNVPPPMRPGEMSEPVIAPVPQKRPSLTLSITRPEGNTIRSDPSDEASEMAKELAREREVSFSPEPGDSTLESTTSVLSPGMVLGAVCIPRPRCVPQNFLWHCGSDCPAKRRPVLTFFLFSNFFLTRTPVLAELAARMVSSSESLHNGPSEIVTPVANRPSKAPMSASAAESPRFDQFPLERRSTIISITRDLGSMHLPSSPGSGGAPGSTGGFNPVHRSFSVSAQGSVPMPAIARSHTFNSHLHGSGASDEVHRRAMIEAREEMLPSSESCPEIVVYPVAASAAAGERDAPAAGGKIRRMQTFHGANVSFFFFFLFFFLCRCHCE
jgi:hypothetical protein